MKFIIILIILIFQSACEKGGFKINQVIDKEQLYKFKAKSKIYSLKDNEFANIAFIEYAQYEFIAKNIVKKNALNILKKKNLKIKNVNF